MVDRVESLGIGRAGAGDGDSIATDVVYGGAIVIRIRSFAPASEGVAVVDGGGVSDGEGFGSVVAYDGFLFWSVSTRAGVIDESVGHFARFYGSET